MSTRKILVVDDDKACCELLKDYFIKHDYAVDIVCDRGETQHLLEENIYEYIIFDYSMPGFSVVDLAKLIKEKNPEAKRILISGYDLVDDKIVKDIGVDAFLRKPFVVEDLGAIVKNG